jgi:hypothetical protein
MKDIDNKIFIIEDFISAITANFIVNNFSKNLKPTHQDGVYVGIGSNDESTSKVSGKNKIFDYDGSSDIAVDLITSLSTNMEKVMSEIFNKDLVMKSFCYNHMKSGGKNPLHYDNYSEEYANDYSGILYLTDNYKGGDLCFPNQKSILHPKPGTFICFIGDKDVEHGVEEVTDGDRVNIICFFKERDKNNG